MRLSAIPLAYLAVAWLVGIAAAAHTGGEFAAAIAVCGLLGAVSVVLAPRWSTLLLVAFGSALVFGAMWRYEEATPIPGSIARFNDQDEVTLRGVISDEPDERGMSRAYRVEVQEVKVGETWQGESGGVIVRAPLFPAYQYGDLVEIEGELKEPPVLGDFDYREYLLRQGVVSQIDYPKISFNGAGHGSRAGLFELRNMLSRKLEDALPEPESSLAGGILFGTRSELPRELRDDMNATGTSHLVAVSGQNVILLAMLVMASLGWLIGRRPAAWVAIAAVLAYAVLVGGQPSVVRAAIMGSVYVGAIIVGRPNGAWVGLALAGAGMTAFDPHIVHEVSFQLSFAATLGLMTTVSSLNRLRDQVVSRWPAIGGFPGVGLLTDVFVTTVAATAFTIPIVAMNFERVSLVSPVANLLAVPSFVLVAASSGLAVVAGLAIPGSEAVTEWIAWPPAAYMIWVVRASADAPIASVGLKWLNVEHAIFYYVVLLAGVWGLSRMSFSVAEPPPASRMVGGRLRFARMAGLAAVFALTLCVVWLASTAPQGGRLSVTFLDVDQGDAILIEGPAGHRILVDGGPSEEAINAALGRNLPFHDRRIDLVVLTHPQVDHLGGLPAVLERYDVRRVLSSAVKGDGAVHRAWVDALASEGTRSSTAIRGQRINLGGGAWLSVLGPSGEVGQLADREVNDASTVLRLEMGGVSFLLTGDIGVEGERALITSGSIIESTVLKVGHHGSRTSTSPEFMRRVRPAVDVISVGEGNRYGHPTDEVLARLVDDLILRTDLDGDITLSTDGNQLWLETQRRDRD